MKSLRLWDLHEEQRDNEEDQHRISYDSPYQPTLRVQTSFLVVLSSLVLITMTSLADLADVPSGKLLSYTRKMTLLYRCQILCFDAIQVQLVPWSPTIVNIMGNFDLEH